MPKKNCWEFQKCGRQPGGDKAEELGICPASIEEAADGLNDGHMGGRCCWVIAGTLCHGEPQGSYASKLSTCVSCKFYQLVHQEEAVACETEASPPKRAHE
ncbi:MAG: hypothetical protein HQK59_08600 [Deltaproteobacteria bacterium]|nr:hypothetical protein [Deltaproteobacteria bacterium]